MDPKLPFQPTPLDWEALDRYLAGDSDIAERSAIDHQLGQDPVLSKVVEAVRVPVDPTLVDDPSAFAARVNAAIDAHETSARKSGISVATPSPARHARRWMYSAVACVALLVGGGIWWQASQAGTDVSTAPTVYTTILGEDRTILLDDGTSVMLAPSTELRVVGRTVTLVGEAFFSVTQHSSTPFIVRARDVETRVLGTGFGVKAYPEDAKVQVVVTEGKVSLRHKDVTEDAGAILTQGYAAEWGTDGIRVWPQADTITALAWRVGRLAFDETPFSDVALQLERWYGKQVVFSNDALKLQNVTANLRRGDLVEVLDLITVPIGVQYKIQDSQIVFSRR